MFKDAKVGDRVWSQTQGWGKIVEFKTSGAYPIIVIFDNEINISYTLEGKISLHDLHPSLFWGEIKFDIPPKPVPNLPLDTKVLVWRYPGDYKHKRYFSHSEDGVVYCFANGGTSWSTGETTPWDNWELAEKETC